MFLNIQVVPFNHPSNSDDSWVNWGRIKCCLKFVLFDILVFLITNHKILLIPELNDGKLSEPFAHINGLVSVLERCVYSWQQWGYSMGNLASSHSYKINIKQNGRYTLLTPSDWIYFYYFSCLFILFNYFLFYYKVNKIYSYL